jgi:hypothetical protein
MLAAAAIWLTQRQLSAEMRALLAAKKPKLGLRGGAYGPTTRISSYVRFFSDQPPHSLTLYPGGPALQSRLLGPDGSDGRMERF